MDRFNRTLKTRMWRYFTKHQTWRYIDVLRDLVQSYNNTHHRSIGMAPSQVSSQNQEQVWQRLYGHDGKGVPKLRVSDRVRISKYKGKFEKGYEANWSHEMFTIHEVHPSEPPVYRLSDRSRAKCWKAPSTKWSCRRCRYPSIKCTTWKRVLQRRKVGRRTEALVKWFGYPLQIQQLDRCQGTRPLYYKD